MKKMIKAAFNDLAQRVLTANKTEQRRHLRVVLDSVNPPPDGKALDFGCGTALFAGTVRDVGLRYWGYDIDDGLVSYAAGLYADCRFTSSLDELRNEAPFDLVLANCCFHHIGDEAAAELLAMLGGMLTENGRFVLIDIIRAGDNDSALHRLFMKLEQGMHVRPYDEYKRLVSGRFEIERETVNRAHLFSINGFPVYNDLAVLICRAKPHTA